MSYTHYIPTVFGPSIYHHLSHAEFYNIVNEVLSPLIESQLDISLDISQKLAIFYKLLMDPWTRSNIISGSRIYIYSNMQINDYIIGLTTDVDHSFDSYVMIAEKVRIALDKLVDHIYELHYCPRKYRFYLEIMTLRCLTDHLKL